MFPGPGRLDFPGDGASSGGGRQALLEQARRDRQQREQARRRERAEELFRRRGLHGCLQGVRERTAARDEFDRGVDGNQLELSQLVRLLLFFFRGYLEEDRARVERLVKLLMADVRGPQTFLQAYSGNGDGDGSDRLLDAWELQLLRLASLLVSLADDPATHAGHRAMLPVLLLHLLDLAPAPADFTDAQKQAVAEARKRVIRQLCLGRPESPAVRRLFSRMQGRRSTLQGMVLRMLRGLIVDASDWVGGPQPVLRQAQFGCLAKLLRLAGQRGAAWKPPVPSGSPSPTSAAAQPSEELQAWIQDGQAALHLLAGVPELRRVSQSLARPAALSLARVLPGRALRFLAGDGGTDMDVEECLRGVVQHVTGGGDGGSGAAASHLALLNLVGNLLSFQPWAVPSASPASGGNSPSPPSLNGDGSNSGFGESEVRRFNPISEPLLLATALDRVTGTSAWQAALLGVSTGLSASSPPASTTASPTGVAAAAASDVQKEAQPAPEWLSCHLAALRQPGFLRALVQTCVQGAEVALGANQQSWPIPGAEAEEEKQSIEPAAADGIFQPSPSVRPAPPPRPELAVVHSSHAGEWQGVRSASSLVLRAIRGWPCPGTATKPGGSAGGESEQWLLHRLVMDGRDHGQGDNSSVRLVGQLWNICQAMLPGLPAAGTGGAATASAAAAAYSEAVQEMEPVLSLFARAYAHVLSMQDDQDFAPFGPPLPTAPPSVGEDTSPASQPQPPSPPSVGTAVEQLRRLLLALYWTLPVDPRVGTHLADNSGSARVQGLWDVRRQLADIFARLQERNERNPFLVSGAPQMTAAGNGGRVGGGEDESKAEDQDEDPQTQQVQETNRPFRMPEVQLAAYFDGLLRSDHPQGNSDEDGEAGTDEEDDYWSNRPPPEYRRQQRLAREQFMRQQQLQPEVLGGVHSPDGEGNGGFSLIPRDPRVRKLHRVAAASVLRDLPFALRFRDRLRILQIQILGDRRRLEASGVRFDHGRGHAVRIRRTHVLQDGFQELNNLGPRLRGRIQVTFVGPGGMAEAGVDGGGVFKDFLTSLARSVFNPEYGLWRETLGGAELYPSPDARLLFAPGSQRHLEYFAFVGRMVGKALYDGHLLEPQFARFFLRTVLARGRNGLADLRSFDPELERNLRRLRGFGGDWEDLALEFTVLRRRSLVEEGTDEVVELVPGGAGMAVTEENYARYTHVLADYLLNRQVQQETLWFREGLWSVVKPELLQMFTVTELQMLISVEDLQQNCRFAGGFGPNHPVIRWLWEVLAELDEADKSLFLFFSTSCSRAPLLGLGTLDPPFCIQRVDGPAADQLLPSSSTCLHILRLPSYSSKEVLRAKLLYAIREARGFGLT